jgi:hypothetical protein
MLTIAGSVRVPRERDSIRARRDVKMLPLKQDRLRQADVAPMASEGPAEPLDAVPQGASEAHGWLVPCRPQAHVRSLE